MALFRIRVCARGTVIWPALYHPVYVLAVCSTSFLTAPCLYKTVVYAYSGRVQRYKNETGTCQYVQCEKKEKIKRKLVSVQFRLSLDPIQSNYYFIYVLFFLIGLGIFRVWIFGEMMYNTWNEIINILNQMDAWKYIFTINEYKGIFIRINLY